MDRVLRFWWGGTVATMSENRKRCYKSIIRNSGVKRIEMITPENYKMYEVKEQPIHEAFQYLSEVHKSDYLRAYVTYHYGGAWTDVKYIDYDWNQYFDMLDDNPNMIAIGCPEMIIVDNEYKRLPPTSVHYQCIGMANFIFREKTNVFKDFITRVDAKLDEKLELLKQYPGTIHPLVCVDNYQHETFPEDLRTYQYPLKWLEISEIYFQTQVPYLDKIMHGMPIPHNFMTGYSHR